jgi:hypothetical protein
MDMLLLVVGIGWALVGVGNFITGTSRGLSEGWIASSLLVNSVLFVVPGLVLVGWGLLRRSRKANRENANGARTETTPPPQ